MAPVGRMSSTINVGGIAMAGLISRTKEGQIGHEATLPAGSDGVQLGFTGVSDITVTMAEGEVIEDADVADVYWYVNGVLFVKYGATVALVGQVATLSGGGGDDYVTGEGTLAMILTKQETIDTDFVGNLVEMIAAISDKVSHITFIEAGPANIDGVKLPRSEPWSWTKNGPFVNLLADATIIEIKASCGDADNEASLKVGVLYDSL